MTDNNITFYDKSVCKNFFAFFFSKKMYYKFEIMSIYTYIFMIDDK